MGPFLRIVLRYAAALLVAKGYLAPGLGDELATDPDVIAAVEMAVGAVIGIATELTYAVAKRLGWRT